MFGGALLPAIYILVMNHQVMGAAMTIVKKAVRPTCWGRVAYMAAMPLLTTVMEIQWS